MNKVTYMVLVDGEFYSLGAFDIAIAELEGLIGRNVGIGDTASEFYAFGGALDIHANGLRMVELRPAVDRDGRLTFEPTGKFVVLGLAGWNKWLLSDAEPGASGGTARPKGRDALACWVRFTKWAILKNVDIAIRLMGDGACSLADVQRDVPEIVRSPVFRDYVADLALAGKGQSRKQGGRGRNQGIQRAVGELVALASKLRTEAPGLSWDKAYESACRQRPEWIPATWRDGDPVGRLKKEAAKLVGASKLHAKNW